MQSDVDKKHIMQKQHSGKQCFNGFHLATNGLMNKRALQSIGAKIRASEAPHGGLQFSL